MPDDDSAKPPGRPPRPKGEDRDVRRPKTPPVGIAEQLGRRTDDAAPRAIISDESSMPIPQSPEEAISQLAVRARTISKELHSTAENVKKIEPRVDELQTKLNTLSVAQQTTGQHVEALAKDVTGLKVDVAVAKGILTVIHDDVKSMKELTVHREKITIETQGHAKKIEIEDHADAKKARRAFRLKVIGIIGGLAAALGTAITALASRGC